MAPKPKSFTELAAAVGDGTVVHLTARDLLRMVGAQRRGIHVVGQIRSQLDRHSLKTEPDFAEVNADLKIEVLRNPEHPPPHVELLTQAAERLRAEPPTPMRVTPRTILGWFGAKRRGSDITESVDAALAGFELETDPDFRSVHLDQPVDLVGRGSTSEDASGLDDPGDASSESVGREESGATAQQADTQTAPNDSAGEPTKAKSSQAPTANNTFHIGTLDEARRDVVHVKPQSSLRVALSQMIAKQVSHLPIMRNPRSVTGMLRWKDVGRYLLLNGNVSLDDPVERAQAPAIEVRYSRPFLNVIPEIIKHGYVLVRGPKNVITGIVTKKDLGRQLLDLASPFVLLGEIERGLRALIENGDFTVQELRDIALDPKSPREIENIASLTLGEYQRLLSHPDAWDRIDLNIDKSTFVAQLSGVRNVRNGVMHFHPDGANDDDRKQLSRFLELIYDLQRFG
ncbi:CBS domain protein [Enhygromyxa salina]|uniref:CBS domain protein n=1 Tax=Enhygromyxa salina TaxID=215803 RepID=A0A2S9XAR9_9BACT|nr:CBS domain-containing protein [Enhygromyxa salina]PRP89890.1 CBS domain protein [Enhygromyxa salina]